MDNSSFLSDSNRQLHVHDGNKDIPNTSEQHQRRKAWSTPVALAVAATTSIDLGEVIATKPDNYPDESSFKRIEKRKHIPGDGSRIKDTTKGGEAVSKIQCATCDERHQRRCTCRRDSNQNMASPSEAEQSSRRSSMKHVFNEEHMRKFMCTLKLFSAEKQEEFDIAEDGLNQMQTCLSRAMNESVYRVNSVADALIAKVNMEREDLVRQITEDGTLAITNMEAQRQFVDDLKRSLQHADEETTDVLGENLDNAAVRKASNLTDKVRKIQVTEPEQYLNPTVIDFEPNSDLDRVNIGRLVERPILAHYSQQDHTDELQKRSSPKRRPMLKFGNGFGRPSSVVIAYDISVDSNDSLAVAGGSGGVLVFSGADGTFTFRFNGPDEERILDAINVAHMSSGNILVIDSKSKDVRAFESHGRFLYKFGTRKSSNDVSESKVRLCSVVVDESDNILVGDRRRKVITMHQPDGAKLQTFSTGIEPDYLAVSSKEIIAVSAGEAFEVQLMNYIGQFLLRVSSLPNGHTLWPKGVFFDDKSKYLYVAHYKSLGDKSIHKYNVLTGRYVECVVRNLSGPNGIALFGDKKLAVADFGCVKIFSIDT